MGMLSPRDSTSATIGNAHVSVNYGRPYRRGRQVGGYLIPWNEVWRTGANAATVFKTDADLDVNGTTVPAGTYTMWTVSTPTSSKLVLSRKLLDDRGQPLWGTMYDAKQDLARIDMNRSTLSQPVDQFVITVEPSGSGGVIRMAWDTIQMTVPFSPKATGT
jgi:hypothetical protein